MSASPSSLPARLRLPAFRRVDAAAIAVLVILTAIILLTSGALTSDFTSGPDEPSHIVSSLLVRDYIAAGFPGRPLPYAQTYYAHYPKVAIGHWPPIFYLGEGLWMLVAGRNRIALLLFSVSVCALLSISLYVWMRRERPPLTAFLSAALLAACPLMYEQVYTVGPDALMGLFAFWGAACLGVFLETRHRRYAALALLFAVLAIGTHGRGVLLVIAFPVAIALCWRRLAKPARLILALAILSAVALVLAVVVVPKHMGQAFPFSGEAVFVHAAEMIRAWPELGVPLIVLGAIGLPTVLKSGPRWKTMAALALGGAAIHAFINVPFAPHFLLGFAAPIAAFAGVGFESVCRLLRRRSLQAAFVTLLACVAAFYISTAPRKPDLGYHRFIPLSGLPGADSKVYLVGGEPEHEGSFICEMNLHSAEASHYILRASKVLAISSWTRMDHRLLFQTSQEVLQALDRMHVGFVVLQQASINTEVPQLETALRAAPAEWSPVPAPNAPAGVVVFRRIGPVPPGSLELNFRLNGGRKLHFRE